MYQQKINYLSNKEMLSEIHKSKSTYCSFLDDSSKDYDIILVDLSELNDQTIEQAKTNRAERLTKQEKEKLKSTKTSNLKISSFAIKSEDIPLNDLVFRIMTTEHIPIDEVKSKKSKASGIISLKLNFPPFKHYRLREDKSPYEVARSHWIGGFENGHFSQFHGKVTPKLAFMFLKIVERYSQKGNWRGYTWIDDMKGQALVQLSDVGLKFDERKGDNPFAYYTGIITNCFRGILNNEERVSDIKNKILIDSGFNPSFDYQGDSKEDF